MSDEVPKKKIPTIEMDIESILKSVSENPEYMKKLDSAYRFILTHRAKRLEAEKAKQEPKDQQE